jgi:hypothetical protein
LFPTPAKTLAGLRERSGPLDRAGLIEMRGDVPMLTEAGHYGWIDDDPI